MAQPWSLVPFPALEDNYSWIVHDGQSALAVDPGEAEPLLTWLDAHALTLKAILITHHHRDHTGGVATLAHATGAQVYGPANEPLPYCDHPLVGNSRLTCPGGIDLTFEVLAVPGHTRGHLAYLGHGWLFCGDTLFSAGCGRLFEGTAQQLYESLARLAALPDETAVCCAHEYTLKNLAFAAHVEPANEAIAAYHAWCEAQQAAGKPTLPSTIGREKQVNPFLRASEPNVRAAVDRAWGSPSATPQETFARLRSWRDRF